MRLRYAHHLRKLERDTYIEQEQQEYTHQRQLQEAEPSPAPLSGGLAQRRVRGRRASLSPGAPVRYRLVPRPWWPEPEEEDSTMQLGAHVSAAGGPQNAPERGREIGCDCIQIFTRNQRQWRVKPISDEEATAFRSNREACGIGAVMSHASYLLNLGTTDPEKFAKTYDAFEQELLRCHKLGVELLNFHPGAHVGKGVESGIQQIAHALNEICRAHPDKTDVCLVLENVAGQGTTLGRSFEELRAILDLLESPERFGVCVDTAHAFAAGYPIHTEAGWEETWAEFDRILGLDRLVALHLNDSKVPFDSRKDRHALIGRGEIGAEAFRRAVTDPRTRNLPMFLETPAGPEGWAREIVWLRQTAAGGNAPLPEIEDAGVSL